ncbi:MAG: hypothetical protein ACXVB0_17600 [Mucilaginibacter sp.]
MAFRAVRLGNFCLGQENYRLQATSIPKFPYVLKNTIRIMIPDVLVNFGLEFFDVEARFCGAPDNEC